MKQESKNSTASAVGVVRKQLITLAIFLICILISSNAIAEPTSVWMVCSPAGPISAGERKSVEVSVSDENGEPVANASVSFSIEVVESDSPSDCVKVWQTSQTTDARGITYNTFRSFECASGTYIIRATSGNASDGVHIIVRTPETVSLSLSASDTSPTPGDTVTFTVRVLRNGSPAIGESVSFSVSGSASLSSQSSTTNSNGEAQTTLSFGSDASGSYTVTASVGSRSVDTTVAVQSTPPTPDTGETTIIDDTSPQNEVVNTPQPPDTGETTPPSSDQPPPQNNVVDTPVQASTIVNTPPETKSPNQPTTADRPPEEPPESTPEVYTPGQITFSELMYTTRGGLFSHPQWIELYNNTAAASVNLKGWRLIVEARDSETRHRYSVLELETLEVAPLQTVLLVTRNRRSSGHLSENQVYDLYRYHGGAFRLGLRENAVLPASGFLLKLFAPDGTLVDTAGNLDGRKGSKDAPAWELPSGRTEDGARTSLIRQYEDNIALTGTEATSWVRAADAELSMNMYYGRETDIGTPGYKNGGDAPVMLSHFRADMTATGVMVEWTTASETNNAGFNILRGQTKEGSFVKVNPVLIQGAGTMAEQSRYTWTDKTAKPNVAYFYRIEDVSFSGDRQRLATVRMRGYVTAAGKFTTTWGQLKTRN